MQDFLCQFHPFGYVILVEVEFAKEISRINVNFLINLKHNVFFELSCKWCQFVEVETNICIVFLCSLTWNGLVVIFGQQFVMLRLLQYCIQAGVCCIHWDLWQPWSCYWRRAEVRASPWLGSIRWSSRKLCYQQSSRLCSSNLCVFPWSWYCVTLERCRLSKLVWSISDCKKVILHVDWTCVNPGCSCLDVVSR